MASSDRVSFMEQSRSSAMLNIKLNQNMVVGLDPLKYSNLVQPLIVYLDHSMLKKALILSENVPLSQLPMAYSTAIYKMKLKIMNFEIQGEKTSISKTCFCKFLGVPIVKDSISPYSIPAMIIIQVYQQMGYNFDLSFLSNFKMSALRPIWNSLFTIIFGCFSEKATDSDSASHIFHILLYGFYSGDNVNIVIVLWEQFVQSPVLKTNDTEISCARFWSSVVQYTMNHYHISEMKDVVIDDIPKMQTTKFITFDLKNIMIVGYISESMLSRVPADKPIIVE